METNRALLVKYFTRHYVQFIGLHKWLCIPLKNRKEIIQGDIKHWEHMHINPITQMSYVAHV